jgi:hypothetical protein
MKANNFRKLLRNLRTKNYEKLFDKKNVGSVAEKPEGKDRGLSSGLHRDNGAEPDGKVVLD